MDPSSRPAGTFYFGHLSAVVMLYTTLGLFEDSTPLLYDNFEESANRNYRTSVWGSFSGNAEFVLYECDEDGEEPTRRLLAMRNERQVNLLGCEEQPLCSWEQFLSLYQVRYTVYTVY